MSDGASVDAEGTCIWTDLDERVASWPTVRAAADAFWAESALRGNDSYGPAHAFVADLTEAGHSAAGAVLQALVDTASSDEQLTFVGAGPLEDLVSHSGHGAAFVDEVERRARRDARFRLAVAATWLGSDVPRDVRSRLAAYGARLL